ncbi:MAG: hypothetical protein KDB00_21985 [Planctomycetales bacterium]|nr:hypothetical protein [Planctomycetales bacterium]
MRHAFDVRQRVSFRTHTGNKSATRSIPMLAGSATRKVPTMSAASMDQFCVETDDRTSPIMLASLFPEARFFACDDVAVTSIAREVGECEPGDTVLYRIGEGDPNVLIAEALARGASGMLTEQLLPCPLPQCIVGSVDHALARIASVANERPDRKLLTVGVLGRSGKTSTCLLTATLTKALGVRTAYQCDLGSSDGVVSETSTRQVPVGADLINWIAESSDCLSRIAIIEIDETAARDGHYDSMEFDVLMVTGKRELSDDFGPCGLQCMLERLTASGVVIAPAGDVRTTRMLEESRCKWLPYGTNADTDNSAIIVDQSGGMSTIMLTSGDTSAMMETPLCGRSMASNLAATAALGGLLGHSPHEIAEHLSSLRSIPGRGQRLVDFGHATVVLETGGSVDRLNQALRTAKATGAGGTVWCVLAIGEDECDETLARFGHSIERHAHHCVVTSKPNQGDAFLQRTHQLLDGVKECAAIRLIADQANAIQWAIESSKPRDTIVVVTNRINQTPHQSRTELEQLESFVNSTRAKLSSQAETESDGEAGTPIKLKLFR